jgi:hypothetical protein
MIYWPVWRKALEDAEVFESLPIQRLALRA